MSTLKEALYLTIHNTPGTPLKQIAEELNMSQSYLTRAALPDQDDCETGTGCRFPLERLIPLVRCTGDYGVLDYIEEQLGRVAVKLPSVKSDNTDFYGLTLNAVKEFGDLMGEIKKDMADKKIGAKERERICKEGYHSIKAIMAFIEAIK
ncbi:MAG: phage regulatory CII family protein [Pseudomonadota bacterium]